MKIRGLLRTSFGACLGIALFAFSGEIGSASSVSIDPTLLQIGRDSPSTDLKVSNVGTDPVRFSVRGYRWHQRPDGTVQLEPTDDLVVYPQTFSIDRLEHRTIRVGFIGQRTPEEQAYRIVVTELPGFDPTPTGGPRLIVRAAYSVPLFITPTAARVDAAVTNVSARRGVVELALVDRGTAHTAVATFRVRGVDDSGSTLFDKDLKGWYLLPGEPRRYTLTVPVDACAKLSRIVVDGTALGASAPLRSDAQLDKAC